MMQAWEEAVSGLLAEERYVDGALIELGWRQHLSGMDEWQRQGGNWQRRWIWIWGMTNNSVAEMGV